MRGLSVGAAAILLWGTAAMGQIDVDNRGVTVDPSGKASPEYGRSIEERNRRKREEAERKGTTHIDTTFGPFGPGEAEADRAPAEREEKRSEAEESAGEIPGTRVPGPAPVSPASPVRPPVGGPSYELSREEVRQGELRELVGELLKALDRGPSVVRLRPAREDREETAAPRTASPAPAAEPGYPAVRAGAGFYARVLYAVNSDFRGPVMVELLEPPLVGAVLTGNFERVRDEMVVRLSRISWRGRESAVDAWAVGLDCACYGLAGQVDRHWWERLVLPAAVRFAEGFLTAKGAAGRRVEVSGETVVDERDDPTSRQAVYAGLGNAARSVGDILLEDAPTGPTVRIPRDTDVAVVFARPPGAGTSTVRVAVPGSRGPTGPEVVRRLPSPPAGRPENSGEGAGAQPARPGGSAAGE